MMTLPIKNSVELRHEIYRLQGVEAEQSEALKKRFSSPGAVFSTVMSLFPKSDDKEDKNSSLFNQDFIGLISRFALPIALNKTLFKNSGFIVKTIVGLLSQKASHYINEDSVGALWGKAKHLFEENVSENPAITGIFGKIKGLFAGKTPKPRLKKAPVPAYVQAS